MHRLTADKDWPPHVVRDMTLVDVLALMSEHPPGEGAVKGPEDVAELIERLREEERQWAAPPIPKNK